MSTFEQTLTTGLILLLAIISKDVLTIKNAKELLSQDIRDTILSQQLFSMIA